MTDTIPEKVPSEKEIIPVKQKRKPARVQIDPETIDADEKPPQTGTIFNIWYSKWSGGDNNDLKLQTHAKTRVNLKLDSGYTRADRSGAKVPVFCLHFARGLCCMGKKCEYLHRLPTSEDRIPMTQDCFGRTKFADYRDDMAGVGNFNMVNTTLYVGRINNINEEGIEFKMNKNFKEFGEIVRIRVIHSKNIAFVTYKNELNAQFAKEAMAHQSLDKDNVNEILNIRWANQDPDPEAQKRNKRKMEENTMESVKQLLAKFDDEPDIKKVKHDDDDDKEDEIEIQTEEGNNAQKSILNSNAKGALQLLKNLQQQRQSKNTLKSAMANYDSSSDED